jgi:hypothetical protein
VVPGDDDRRPGLADGGCRSGYRARVLTGVQALDVDDVDLVKVSPQPGGGE